MRIYTCIILLFGCFWAAQAQNTKLPPQGAGILYNKEVSLNIKLHTTRGLSIGAEWGKLKTYYRTNYYFASIGELKHPKEKRQSGKTTASGSFRPYIFGKKNNFFALRAGWGHKRYYSEKAKHKGVALATSLSFGPTLGLLKPYYLVLPASDDNRSPVHSKYSEENAAYFLNETHVLGASPFTKGLAEMKFLPGANFSYAVHLDWGAFDEFVKALEIGIMIDAFPKKVPIFAVGENTPYFLNFFVNLQLGKRS